MPKITMLGLVAAAIVLGGIALSSLTAMAAPTSERGVVPEVLENTNLAGEGGTVCNSTAVNGTGETWLGAKVDPADPGTVTTAGFEVTVSANDLLISWDGMATSNVMKAVVGKFGNDTYVYYYNPPLIAGETVRFDSGLGTGQATASGTSHYVLCYVAGLGEPEEELTVSKTVTTTFDREHAWDIAKSVDTETVWLFTDGSGDETVTWTVDVTYEGSEDSGHNVSGVITIENTGAADATITDIEDLLAGTEVAIDCGDDDFALPFMLLIDDTLECTYSVDVDGPVQGNNVVTVTTESGGEYDDSESIEWGDPAKETNATVNVSDLSDLLGAQDLGSVTAPNGDSFTYSHEFNWDDYGQSGCGEYQYNNTARIDETGQSADASVPVNVQCFLDETAWAANGNTPGFNRYNTRGNWATYVVYAEKCTTLFAGQTIDVGEVCFSAVSGGNVTIAVTLEGGNVFADAGSNLKVQGYPSVPSGNPAPGKFANKATCDTALQTCQIVVPAATYYGVHVDTWVPDPDFGP